MLFLKERPKETWNGGNAFVKKFLKKPTIFIFSQSIRKYLHHMINMIDVGFDQDIDDKCDV